MSLEYHLGFMTDITGMDLILKYYTMKQTILFLSFILLFIACDSEKENEEAPLRQSHISFENPLVGQRSKYLMFDLPGEYFSISSYLEDTLVVTIEEQINETSFIVSEDIVGDYEYPEWELDNQTIRNIWRFENDSLFVEPLGADFDGSYIAGINIINYWLGYGFSLTPVDDNYLDMETASFEDIDWYGTGYTDDYTLLNHQFTDLFLDASDHSGLDGPVKLRCYNLSDGFVRMVSFDLNLGAQIEVYGMDLLLD